MSARYSTAQLRGTASNGIPHTISLGELSSELFGTASTEEPGMRKMNTRNFCAVTRGTLCEINREMMPNLIREPQPSLRPDQTNFSPGNCTAVRPQVFRCFQSKFFIGGY